MVLLAYALGTVAGMLRDPLVMVTACLVLLITLWGRYLWIVPLAWFAGSMANIWMISARYRALGMPAPEGRIMMAWALTIGMVFLVGLFLRWFGKWLKSV